MQRLEGLARKAMQAYSMVQAGDAVCVGVSGGKDSVALATALKHLSSYYELPYTVQALTLDPCFGGVQTDYSELSEYFGHLGIPYTVVRTDIGPVVFNARREQNPCALCAKMRRGALHKHAAALGCNRVSTGHHLDDAIETFYMNLFGGGHIGCFSPVTWLSRSEVTLIRPLVLACETEVACAAHGLPVQKSRCPVDGKTARQRAKQFVQQQAHGDPAFRQKMLGALQKSGLDGWAPVASGSHRGLKGSTS